MKLRDFLLLKSKKSILYRMNQRTCQVLTFRKELLLELEILLQILAENKEQLSTNC
ncbi:hypothetical protein HLRTI_001686 [Halorhabdus tiamatea SARL4B]|uniref:Uncharacterized protein n=1 Tax=Halorhabdus tiamatea SARL4B TaxID=1033806 RepID=U2DK26_9EURY|nr:hypothetical protein HLRTI_001686 [Halorhabdus tiamatea SARL4B]